MWLTMLVSPIVAIPASRPSISGTHAASSDPNTSTRITSVNGTDRMPACESCVVNSLVSALLVLVKPASPT
jgi:hypothetical protein